MFDKLYAVQRRFAQINHLLQQPETVSDSQSYQQLMKEYRETEPIVQAFAEYNKVKADYEEARELLEMGGLEADFKEIVQQQLCENREKLEPLEQKMKMLLLPKDANDDKSIIVEIRAGAGGEEAALFAHSLHRMYTMYAQKMGLQCEVLNSNDTELGGVKEVSFTVEGEGAYHLLKFESGVHRVQRVPETESQGRIQTSTVTVAVLPQAEEVEFELDPKDLRIDTFRSSGAGGQHINKTSSAIRVTHIPTGTVVECQNERSQFQNKDKALQILRSRLLKEKQDAAAKAYNDHRSSLVGSGDRSEKIRTYNFPQDRVTDHRIGYTQRNISSFMNGNLEDLLERLQIADQTEKLKAAGEAN